MPKSTPQSFMIAIINQPMALRMPRTFDRVCIFLPMSSYIFLPPTILDCLWQTLCNTLKLLSITNFRSFIKRL